MKMRLCKSLNGGRRGSEMKIKAIVQFQFYDGWGSRHAELHEVDLIRQKDGKLVPTLPNPARGVNPDNWTLIQILKVKHR